MTDFFVNPITMSFNLLASYKNLLHKTLLENGLSAADADTILANIEVDKSVLFSLNRRYQRGDTSFRQFCRNHGLVTELADYIPLEKLYLHQEKAICSILAEKPTIISTGTGSGKTESFLIPIIDYCLKHPGPGVKAIIIYPMNALAGDQLQRVAKATESTDITFGIYVGSTPENQVEIPEEEVERFSRNHVVYREDIRQNPPNILITNYVMLDWMLTGENPRRIFLASQDTVKYIVLDEIHTYRGNKATHLKYLLARLKFLLNERIVLIGASATLREEGSEGYLAGEREEALGEFIKPLLEVTEYKFIKPTYEVEPELRPRPLPTFPHSQDFGWALQVDNHIAFENLSRLIGERCEEMDLGKDFTQSKSYQALQHDEFVLQIKKKLLTGAQSFLDLVQVFNKIYPQTEPHPQTEEIVRAYLSAIAFINHNAGRETPLLDFRIHLFLKNLGGSLKKCIKCQKYHSGYQEFCNECGFPLFLVYRGDIRKCIGKVTDNKLKYELKPESDDKKNSYYVLISLGNSDQADGLSLGFSETARTIQGQIILDYDEYGQLCLELFQERYDQVEKEIIPLIDGTKDYQYLHQLVKSVLDFHSGPEKKLLGFIDNCENASRYSSVLQDEFIDQFFEEFLKLRLPTETKLDLVKALECLQDRGLQEYLSDVEAAVFQELSVWYARYISIPARFFESKKALLELKDPGDLKPFEKELLDLFIRERAIDKRAFGEFNQTGAVSSRFIRFYKYWATSQRGFCFPKNHSEDAPFESIIFSEQPNSIYYDFVKQHGLPLIEQTLEHLKNNRDIIIADSRERTHYYLNPRYICFNLPKSELNDYEELRQQFLLTAALHSAELKSKQRREVENSFKCGHLHFLLATPTLEMGIDIGKPD